MTDYYGKGLRSGEVGVGGHVNGAPGSSTRVQQSHQAKEDVAGAVSHQPRLIKSRTSLEMHSNSARGMKAAHQQDQTVAIRPIQ